MSQILLHNRIYRGDMVKTDEELMMDYIEGDLVAFETLYTRLKKQVFGFLSTRVSAQSKDDIFQLIFLKLHQKKHLYNKSYPFKPWFYTLMRNTIIDHFRTNKIEFSELNFDIEDTEAEQQDELNLNVSAEDEKLLYKKFVEGHGYKELEEEFGSQSSALRKRVSRLLKKLRGEL